tara:strand:- start:489 stop:1550 length:1062 start_codon:yes stop_codon:yes gene_type:complete
MNKFYVMLVMFAISGLLFANIPAESNAASNLGYMLTIAENAKKYCKSGIEARENVSQEILDLYLKSISDVDKLQSAIDANDIKSAREYFISSMQKMRQISIALNELEVEETKHYLPIQRNPTLDRYEMNIQKLKSISIKLGASIDFHEIDNLMVLAKENHKNGNSEKTKQMIQDIAKKGMTIYQTLQNINEENKIIRAKALAEKHIQKINILILQAKELGLDDSISKLEQSKTQLISANNTSQIKHNIKIIITLQTQIEKSKSDIIRQLKQTEIQFSEQQKLSLQISQLENRINLMASNAQGNNIAIYYLEKASALTKSAKLDLNNSLDNIPEKINQIEDIISKAERLLQAAA